MVNGGEPGTTAVTAVGGAPRETSWLGARLQQFRARATWRFWLGEALVFLSAAASSVSAGLYWADTRRRSGPFRLRAVGVPLQFLVHRTTAARNPTVALALVVIAVLCGLGGLLATRFAWGPVVLLAGGAFGGLIPVLYAVQIHWVLDDLPPAGRVALLDFLGAGPYVALAGCIAAITAALLLFRTQPLRPRSGSDAVTADA
jgi:hypothetical protein